MLETSLGNGNGSAVVRKGAVGGVVGAEPDKVFSEGVVVGAELFNKQGTVFAIVGMFWYF